MSSVRRMPSAEAVHVMVGARTATTIARRVLMRGQYSIPEICGYTLCHGEAAALQRPVRHFPRLAVHTPPRCHRSGTEDSPAGGGVPPAGARQHRTAASGGREGARAGRTAETPKVVMRLPTTRSVLEWTFEDVYATVASLNRLLHTDPIKTAQPPIPMPPRR